MSNYDGSRWLVIGSSPRAPIRTKVRDAQERREDDRAGYGSATYQLPLTTDYRTGSVT